MKTLELYNRQKPEFPNAVLLVRRRDFFTTFFADAETLSRVCDIMLSTIETEGGGPVPFCFFHSLSHDDYVSQLLRAGFAVEIVPPPELAQEALGQ